MPDPRAGTPRRLGPLSMMTLALLAFHAASLIFLLFVVFRGGPRGGIRGIGHADLTLRFVVLDSATSRPIPGAAVGLYEADHFAIIERAETSTSGVAELTRNIPFYLSSDPPPRKTRAIVHLEGFCFEVSAPGYRPARHWLSQFTGQMHDLELAKPVPAATVRLDRIGDQ